MSSKKGSPNTTKSNRRSFIKKALVGGSAVTIAKLSPTAKAMSHSAAILPSIMYLLDDELPIGSPITFHPVTGSNIQQTIKVPTNTQYAIVNVKGAGGALGGAGDRPGTGGDGGSVQTYITVFGGDELLLKVGEGGVAAEASEPGYGGEFGGASGGIVEGSSNYLGDNTIPSAGGAGGGYSSISMDPSGEGASTLVMAGGGGGGGGNNQIAFSVGQGGRGGDQHQSGSSGGDEFSSFAGKGGGNAESHITKGEGVHSGADGNYGQFNGFGVAGGAGGDAANPENYSGGAGGGGGGGWYGGGGGGAGGGAVSEGTTHIGGGGGGGAGGSYYVEPISASEATITPDGGGAGGTKLGTKSGSAGSITITFYDAIP